MNDESSSAIIGSVEALEIVYRSFRDARIQFCRVVVRRERAGCIGS